MLHKVLMVAAGVGFFVLAASAQTGNPGGAINDNLGEMDYGICRGVELKCFLDWPRDPTAQYRLLVYTKTAGYRHANLGPPLLEGLNPSLSPKNVVHQEMLKIAS